MSKEKALYTGIIEKDDKNNFFCGPYLLDYQHVMSAFKVGDKVEIRSAIKNPSAMSSAAYPKKTRDFFLTNDEA